MSRLADWDRRYVWHPFTQQSEWERHDPLIIAGGKGVWLQDTRGRRFLDGVSSLWCNAFGHRHPALDAALRRQIRKISHATFLGLTHEPAIRLAKRLVDLAPGNLSRVFYSDNGSTAVEVALKMAVQYWQLSGRPLKKRFLSLKGSYHGDTIGAVAVGGIDMYHARFGPLLFKGSVVDPVAPDAFERIEAKIRREAPSLAAVVLEPLVQGAAGLRLMPKGLLAHAARLCRRYGVLLIVDEVLTGFGRCGTMFAVEQEKVVPDLLCVSKSLTGGYLPLAATLTNERIFNAFRGRYDEFKTFFHGHTYTANPLACAAALATLDVLKKERILANVQARHRELRTFLNSMADHPHVASVRSLGLMGALDLVADKRRGTPYRPNDRVGLQVCKEALKHGVWIRPLGDTIVLMPPLSVSANELDLLVRAVRHAIDSVTATRRPAAKTVSKVRHAGLESPFS